MYDIRTSSVPVVQLFTNTIYFTNTVPQTSVVERVVERPTIVMVTNTITGQQSEQVRTVLVTNIEFKADLQRVVEAIQRIEARTNHVEQHDYKPKAEVATRVRDVGSGLGGLAGPFGAIGGALAGGLYALYGKHRSKKVQGSLVQAIETAREVISATSHGDKMEDAFRTWLMQHQAAAGVIGEVSEIVKTAVNNDTAKAVASDIVKKAT